MTAVRMNRYAGVALVLSLLCAPLFAADGKDVYESACMKCHRTGIDDAPKTGNKAAWAPRLAAGKEALVKSVIEGKGAMEPRAGNAELTDDEIRAAVDYLMGMAK